MSIYEEIDRFHCRKNPRMQQFDHRSPNYYFLTICTLNKECLFGTIPEPNRYGSVAKTLLEEIPLHFPGVSVDKYVVMPNHIHAIFILDGTVNLSTVVGQYKAAVTKEIHNRSPHIQVWQPSFHDHVIRNQADYERIWAYIDTNPARWVDDCFYTP